MVLRRQSPSNDSSDPSPPVCPAHCSATGSMPGTARSLFAAERLEVVVKAEAKKRQGQGGRERGRGQTASGKLPEAIDGDTRDIVAKAVAHRTEREAGRPQQKE